MPPRRTASGRRGKRFFFIIMCGLCLHMDAEAMTMRKDHYELNGRLENVSRLFVLPPRFIVGNREALGRKLDEASVQYKQGMKAVNFSSLTSFTANGYHLDGAQETGAVAALQISPALSDEMWIEVARFTDEWMHRKRDLLPYRSHRLAERLKGIVGGADAAIFIQLYGSFDYNISTQDEVAGTIGGNVIVNALTIPLMGTMVVGGKAGEYCRASASIGHIGLKFSL